MLMLVTTCTNIQHSIGDFYGPHPPFNVDELVEARQMRGNQRALQQTQRAQQHEEIKAVHLWNPFEHNNTMAFAAPYRESVVAEWSRRSNIARAQSITTATAVEAGMSWNSIAVAFIPSFDFKHPPSIFSKLKTMLQSPRRKRQHIALDAIIQGDLESSRPKPQLPRDNTYLDPLLRQLRQRGFFKIDSSWGLTGPLAKEAAIAVSATLETPSSDIRKYVVGRSPDKGQLSRDRIASGVEDLAKHVMPKLKSIATSYLGQDTDYDGGYVALHLPSHSLSHHEYVSGLWHHDRCGNRLKCFVFLSDVSLSAHPTQIATGSQRNVYYSYDMLEESRFDDQYISANYEVQAMLGQAGEGFCFDTNTVHRGLLEGNESRTCLIFEFNAFAKSQILDREICNPCGGFRELDESSRCHSKQRRLAYKWHRLVKGMALAVCVPLFLCIAAYVWSDRCFNPTKQVPKSVGKQRRRR